MNKKEKFAQKLKELLEEYNYYIESVKVYDGVIDLNIEEEENEEPYLGKIESTILISNRNNNIDGEFELFTIEQIFVSEEMKIEINDLDE